MFKALYMMLKDVKGANQYIGDIGALYVKKKC